MGGEKKKLSPSSMFIICLYLGDKSCIINQFKSTYAKVSFKRDCFCGWGKLFNLYIYIYLNHLVQNCIINCFYSLRVFHCCLAGKNLSTMSHFYWFDKCDLWKIRSLFLTNLIEKLNYLLMYTIKKYFWWSKSLNLMLS